MQAVEVPTVRAQFAEYLGIEDRRPDLMMRLDTERRYPSPCVVQ
jgi:hypothetical protein